MAEITDEDRIRWALEPAWPPPGERPLVYVRTDEQGYTVPYGFYATLVVQGRMVRLSTSSAPEVLKIAGDVVLGSR